MKYAILITLILAFALPASALTTKSIPGSNFLLDTATGHLCGYENSDGTTSYLTQVSPYSTSAIPTNGVQATLTSDMTNANADVTLASVAYTAEANQINVTYIDPSANSAALEVAVTGINIKVFLATNSGGTITSTCNAVCAAINAHALASALVTATAEGTGLGVVNAKSKAILASGVTATPGIVGLTLYVNTTTGIVYRKSDANTWVQFLPAGTSGTADYPGRVRLTGTVSGTNTGASAVLDLKMFDQSDSSTKTIQTPAAGYIAMMGYKNASGTYGVMLVFPDASTTEIRFVK